MRGGISRELMAQRVAAELGPGQVVHLGGGLPDAVAAYVPRERGVVFHSTDGVLSYGSPPGAGQGVANTRGRSGGVGQPTPAGAVVGQADSLGIIRGGYLDVAALEALQVSQRGDLLDPSATRQGPGATPSSTDVVLGAKRLVAMMEHTTPDGAPRIVRECSHPPIPGSVFLIVTDMAVVQVAGHGLLLKELAPGWSVEAVQRITEARLVPAPDLKEMEFTRAPRGPASKVYPGAAEAVADIPDGSVVMLDGFAGPGGMAQCLILALRNQGARDLTIVSNTAGIANVAGFGVPTGFRTVDHSLLVDSGQVRKAVASFPVSPSPSRPNSFELAYKRGEADLELVPQGTLAERIRAAGYGIAAFYTPTGAGTPIAEGKEVRVINGREYLLERALRADYALLRAHKADRLGNLVYKGTSRNFNAVMAPAADVTIVEVDEIVEPGELDPDAVVTPGIFVQRIVRRPPDFRPFEPAATPATTPG